MSQIEPKSTQDFRQAQKFIADFKEKHNRQLQGLIALVGQVARVATYSKAALL